MQLALYGRMSQFNPFYSFQNMIQIKERKEMEDLFKKAQKPWAKHLVKVEKTKADYHAACKAEKTVSNQERNASSDSSLSPDQVSTCHPNGNKNCVAPLENDCFSYHIVLGWSELNR